MLFSLKELRKVDLLVFIAAAYIGIGLSYSFLSFFQLSLFFSLVVSAICLNKDEERLLNNLDLKILLLIFGILIASILNPVSDAPLRTKIFYSFGFLFNLSIPLLLLIRPNDVSQRNLSKIICVLFFLEMFLGLLEAFSVLRYPISAYSFSSQIFGKSVGVPLKELLLYDDYYRTSPTGFRWNTNNFGLLVLASLSFYIAGSWKFFFLRVLAVFLLVCTGSRYLYLLMMIYFFCNIYFSREKIKSFLNVLVALLMPVLLVNFSSYRPKALEIFSTLESYLELEPLDNQVEKFKERNSVSFRRDYSLLMLSKLESPRTVLFGLGSAGANFLKDDKKDRSPHNFPLEVLVNHGVVFLSLLIWFCLRMLRYPSQSKLHSNIKTSFILLCFGTVGVSSATYFLPLGIMLSLLVLFKYKRDFSN